MQICIGWPEGEGKRFASEMLEQVYGPRRVKMTRPHMCKLEFIPSYLSLLSNPFTLIDTIIKIPVLNLMFTHPSHRRRGVGKLLMSWGMSQAETRNLEVFIEATDVGVPLYESCGLSVMYVDHLDAYEQNPSDEWRRYSHELLPLHWYFMWKPKGGVYEKGKTVVPWETGMNRR